MWKSQVLITRSSNVIKFFKQEHSETQDRKIWTEYHEIKSTGFVSTNRHTNMFQVIEDKHIYFYTIDE